MITPSAWRTSITKGVKTLKEIGLFKGQMTPSLQHKGLSDTYKASFRKTYLELFKSGLDNFDYDVILYDDSYFQFSYSDKPNYSARLVFHQSPLITIPYGEFLRSELETSEDEVGNMYLDLYEQFLISSPLLETAQYIRYDYDFSGYKPNIHAASHFHIGHLSDVRIPCSKLITPSYFILFIIKHFYYRIWKDKYCLKNNYINDISASLDECLTIPSSHWKRDESLELHLHGK